MIRAVLGMNAQGKPRLAKFCEFRISPWKSSKKLFEKCLQFYVVGPSLFAILWMLSPFLARMLDLSTSTSQLYTLC
ncbi:unnamed protein product [Lathyrus oleraceus]